VLGDMPGDGRVLDWIARRGVVEAGVRAAQIAVPEAVFDLSATVHDAQYGAVGRPEVVRARIVGVGVPVGEDPIRADPVDVARALAVDVVRAHDVHAELVERLRQVSVRAVAGERRAGHALQRADDPDRLGGIDGDRPETSGR
jgi:hypothetical protein